MAVNVTNWSWGLYELIPISVKKRRWKTTCWNTWQHKYRCQEKFQFNERPLPLQSLKYPEIIRTHQSQSQLLSRDELHGRIPFPADRRHWFYKWFEGEKRAQWTREARALGDGDECGSFSLLNNEEGNWGV